MNASTRLGLIDGGQASPNVAAATAARVGTSPVWAGRTVAGEAGEPDGSDESPTWVVMPKG
ncbi:hypothetical protein GCM10022399_13260 [Terrabacter ginsenosidimutans]|uniref:Uncharacterized protein n=1 Tax=Terrabacter ginsenosidimutans TaxID=490575 RepID=A0ABP7CYD5_9MICO